MIMSTMTTSIEAQALLMSFVTTTTLETTTRKNHELTLITNHGAKIYGKIFIY